MSNKPGILVYDSKKKKCQIIDATVSNFLNIVHKIAGKTIQYKCKELEIEVKLENCSFQLSRNSLSDYLSTLAPPVLPLDSTKL